MIGFSGIAIPKNKAIVGANAFAHESGIHQDGVLKNAETYEIITPELVGIKHNSLPLGKLSGRHAFSEKLTELNIAYDDESLAILFEKFKKLADKKKEITDFGWDANPWVFVVEFERITESEAKNE